MGRNPQITSAAGKQAVRKLAKIKQLGITPDMAVEDIDAIVMNLAEAKAIVDNKNIKECVSGQEYYVNMLVEFAGMTPLEQLNAEYETAFFEVASEEELLAKLESMSAIPTPVAEEQKEVA